MISIASLPVFVALTKTPEHTTKNIVKAMSCVRSDRRVLAGFFRRERNTSMATNAAIQKPAALRTADVVRLFVSATNGMIGAKNTARKICSSVIDQKPGKLFESTATLTRSIEATISSKLLRMMYAYTRDVVQKGSEKCTALLFVFAFIRVIRGMRRVYHERIHPMCF